MLFRYVSAWKALNYKIKILDTIEIFTFLKNSDFSHFLAKNQIFSKM